MKYVLTALILLIAIPAHAFYVDLVWEISEVNEAYAFGYRLYYDDKPHSEADGIRPDPGGFNRAYPYNFMFTTSNPTVNTARIEDLPAGLWCFRITAWNDVVETHFSPEVCAEVTENITLEIPTGFQVDEVGP